MVMTYRALVPVKALGEVKTRLATYLTLHQRQQLMLDMLHHVLYVLQASRAVEEVTVVSPDRRVLDQAALWGALPLKEEAQGHNAALHAAALREKTGGITGLLTIAADLPLLHPDDIRAVVSQAAQFAVTLAPARDGTGTNAILCQPPLALPYLFGQDSFRHYQNAARRRMLNFTTYSSIGLGLDIDTIDDLDDLHELQILSGEHAHSWQDMLSGI